MKIKTFALLSMFISVLTLASCNNNSDPYKEKIEVNTDKLILKGDIVRNYDVSTEGASININNLKVYYLVEESSSELPYFNSDEKDITPNQYFFTLSNTTPSISRMKKSTKMQSNKPKSTLNVYVACYVDTTDKLYVSKEIAITLTNSKALNPVLYWVGGSVIIVAVCVLVYFSRKYKQEHPNN